MYPFCCMQQQLNIYQKKEAMCKSLHTHRLSTLLETESLYLRNCKTFVPKGCNSLYSYQIYIRIPYADTEVQSLHRSLNFKVSNLKREEKCSKEIIHLLPSFDWGLRGRKKKKKTRNHLFVSIASPNHGQPERYTCHQYNGFAFWCLACSLRQWSSAFWENLAWK